MLKMSLYFLAVNFVALWIIARFSALFGFGGPVESSQDNAGFFRGTASIGTNLESTEDFSTVAIPISSFEEEANLQFQMSFNYKPIYKAIPSQPVKKKVL